MLALPSLVKDVLPGVELRVWYGAFYARKMDKPVLKPPVAPAAGEDSEEFVFPVHVSNTIMPVIPSHVNDVCVCYLALRGVDVQ